MRLRLLPIVLVGVLGCGGDDPVPVPAANSSSSSSTGAGPAPEPAIHFYTDAEVTRIFYPEQITVRLTDFPPGSQVTVRAAMPAWSSEARFAVSETGAVDLGADAPLEGSYEGADADGLFWSMLPTGELPPVEPDVDVHVTAEVDGAVLAEADLARDTVADGVTETPVTDDGLVAVLVTPAAPGPHPALITFGGSEGGLTSGKGLARFYASLGYTCLGIAYFAEAGLPMYLDEVPLEYFAKAIEYLKARPEADPEAIGVMGGSRGGELALLLGATFPEVKAVIAQVPSGVIWPGYDPVKGLGSSWTYEGMPLPWLPSANVPPTVTKNADGKNVKHYTPTFNASLDQASPEELDLATIRAEDSTGPVLLLGGADDQLWPSCRLAQIAMDRLQASKHADAHADHMECYPDAGHSIGAPGLPTAKSSEVLHPITHELLALGGTPAGIAHAARDAFDKKRAFLAAALK